jgi:hypothetical protein
MKPDEPREWKRRLLARLSSDADNAPDDVAVREAGNPAGAVLEILRVTRSLARAISGAVDGVEMLDRNKYDFVAGRIETILSFDDFSLAEYSYASASEPGKRPGLRIWLQRGEPRSIVEVILFEDVVAWRVDERGNKLSETLLTLSVDEHGAVSVLSHRLGRDCDGAEYRTCLAAAFCAPVERYLS